MLRPSAKGIEGREIAQERTLGRADPSHQSGPGLSLQFELSHLSPSLKVGTGHRDEDQEHRPHCQSPPQQPPVQPQLTGEQDIDQV